MLRLIQCEFLKLKRKRLFQAAFLTTFIMPVLYSLLLSDSSFDDLMSEIREENGFLIMIPQTVDCYKGKAYHGKAVCTSYF